jgi:hypothetical protein
MEKIVILTNPSEGDDILISCLQVLFPGCEIRFKSNETETLESKHIRRGAVPAHGKEAGSHGEYPDCRR